MKIPTEFGRFAVEEEEVEASDQPVPYTRPKDSLSMHQKFRISPNARNSKHFSVTIELYL